MMTRLSHWKRRVVRTAMVVLASTVCSAVSAAAPAPAKTVKADAAPPEAHYPRNAAEFDEMFEKVKNWGRWGANDQLGTMNLITPEVKQKALALAKTGLSVSMSHPVITKPLAEPGSKLLNNGASAVVTVKPDFQYDAGDVYTFDYHAFLISHLDAICHFFWKGKVYNGKAVADVVNVKEGCREAGIETVRDGIVTRGIIVDIPWLRGVPYLEPGTPVYPEDFEAWERKTGIRIRSGDAVFLRTGRWERWAKVGPWSLPDDGSAGFHASLALWLKQRDVAVLGTDAGDVFPSYVKDVPVAGHIAVINAMGMPLFDDLDLDAAARTANRLKRWEFLFVAAPLVVPGGTGSPINPLAIF